MSSKIENLRWVRAFSPEIVPKYLVEQVRDRDYPVEDFYKYQGINCLVDNATGPTLNPLNHLYVLADEGNLVKGYLWFVIDPLSKDAVIYTYSIDKDYWMNGKAVKKAADHMKFLKRALKIKRIYWLTTYPKHSERHGFKRSKSVLMEYQEDSDGQDSNGKHRAQEEHLDAHAGATAAPEPVVQSAGSGSSE